MASDAVPPPLAVDRIPAHPLAPAPYRVVDRIPETPDTTTLVLRAVNDDPGTPFQPGQFNMLYAFGVGEAAISICGDPARPAEPVHTVRSAGKISNALAALGPGAVVGLRGPYGVGWPLDRAVGQDQVIGAGGLGLPPLRPAIYRFLAERARYGRIELIYGARTPKDLVFYEEIQRWRALGAMRLQVTVDAADRSWAGDVGLVTARLPDARFDPGRTTALLCGPEIMMRLTAEALLARGVAADAIFVSMERNMKCAVGLCGHCQFGPEFVCRDGPVFPYSTVRRFLAVREI